MSKVKQPGGRGLGRWRPRPGSGVLRWEFSQTVGEPSTSHRSELCQPPATCSLTTSSPSGSGGAGLFGFEDLHKVPWESVGDGDLTPGLKGSGAHVLPRWCHCLPGQLLHLAVLVRCAVWLVLLHRCGGGDSGRGRFLSRSQAQKPRSHWFQDPRQGSSTPPKCGGGRGWAHHQDPAMPEAYPLVM